MTLIRSVSLLTGLLAISCLPAAENTKQPEVPENAEADSVLAGHSYHGEVFNEGPRQAAVMIPGMGSIDFPTSTESATAQRFVEQGVLQLHGFWYLEAERSFRQAAAEDPELAIAYWGMSMANANNQKRARAFIDEAMKRRNDKTSPREKLYIEALDQLIDKDDRKKGDQAKEEKAKKDRNTRYLAGMEKILDEYPEDIEAKAFIAVHLWKADGQGLKLTSRYAVDALISEVFAKNPMHSSHHYRIHLWDRARAKNALTSAAMCGPSSPGIAHMWHMPGHIYSRLKRYSDAAWQQEASARVDHSHMIRTRLMPDQIHNFAHNNEWLVRNLIFIGRVNDALDLSRNLVSLPRHPRYNTLQKRGSYSYGRQRLLQVLTEYSLWEELVREAAGHYLPPTDDDRAQEEWLGWLAVAHFMTGDTKRGSRTLRSLRRRVLALQNQRLDIRDNQSPIDEESKSDQSEAGDAETNANESDKSEEEAKKEAEEIKKKVEPLRRVIARAAAAAATNRKDLKKLKEHLEVARLDSLIKAQWLADAGDLDEAINLAEKAVKSGESQVRPLAVFVDLLWRKNRKKEAIEQFEKLRTVAGSADIETPLLAKLEPVAKAAGIDGDWRTPGPPADDLGDRPPLDELGPFRWQPYEAPAWSAKSSGNELVSGEEFRERPCVLIFYLGFGCLHCIEQLHTFSPMLEAYREAGIDVVAVSTETVEELQLGIKNFDGELGIPLLSDGEKQVFKSYRCWDDFENQPLHGTFLIDSRGQVRWQDISYEPFNEPEFLLNEAKRLLELP